MPNPTRSIKTIKNSIQKVDLGVTFRVGGVCVESVLVAVVIRAVFLESVSLNQTVSVEAL